MKKNNYKLKMDVMEIKKQQLLEHPLGEYFLFVINRVCEIMKLDKDIVLSESQIEYMVQARYYIVDIISSNTNVGSDIMYLLNRDRTTYYYVIDEVGKFKKSFLENHTYTQCSTACKMSEFISQKQEKGTTLYQ